VSLIALALLFLFPLALLFSFRSAALRLYCRLLFALCPRCGFLCISLGSLLGSNAASLGILGPLFGHRFLCLNALALRLSLARSFRLTLSGFSLCPLGCFAGDALLALFLFPLSGLCPETR
jgi:hypothetical protein